MLFLKGDIAYLVCIDDWVFFARSKGMLDRIIEGLKEAKMNLKVEDDFLEELNHASALWMLGLPRIVG